MKQIFEHFYSNFKAQFKERLITGKISIIIYELFVTFSVSFSPISVSIKDMTYLDN